MSQYSIQTVSVFVSSTFSDMQSERDYLNRIIVPKLEEEFKNHNINLRVIDLRWGIELSDTDESERENQVLKVCLNEINNCKPFFIGLLGNRYGWVPSEERIKAAVSEEGFQYDAKNKSVTALEMEYVLLNNSDQLQRCRFYLRKPDVYKNIPGQLIGHYSDSENINLSKEEQNLYVEKLQDLKSDIHQYYNSIGDMSRIRSYDASWENDCIAGLEEWGEMLYNDLKEDLTKYIPEISDTIPSSPYEIEKHSNTIFVDQRVNSFCGREGFVSDFIKNLRNREDNTSGIFLTGESGSGKSSVFAKIYHSLNHDEDILVLKYFCGQTPKTVYMSHMLQMFIFQMEEALEYSVSEYIDFPNEEKLIKRFEQLIKEVGTKGQVYLLIDAIDQMENRDEIRHFSWLPSNWYEYLYLFVTTTKSEILPRIGKEQIVIKKLEAFSRHDASQTIKALAGRVGKAIPETVQESILNHKKEAYHSYESPLWINLTVGLLLAFDKKDFEKIYSLEKEEGSKAIETYMLQLLKELPGEPGQLFVLMVEKAGVYFGSEWFVEQVLSLMAFSRSGVSEDMLGLLVDEEWDLLKFSNLRRWFRAYIVDKGNARQWTFSHQLPKNALQTKYKSREVRVHELIAKQLMKMDLSNSLLREDLFYHLYHADMKKETARFLAMNLEEKDREWFSGKLTDLIIQHSDQIDWFYSLVSKMQDSAGKQLINILLIFQTYAVNYLKARNEFDLQLQLLNFTRKWHEELFRDDPDKNWWGYILAVNYEKMGDYNLAIDNYDEAEKWYRKRLQLGEEMYGKSPTEEFKIALSVGYDKLAEVKTKQGEYEEAKRLITKKITLSEEILQDGTNEEEGLDKLSAGKMTQAEILQKEGRLDEAIEVYHEAFVYRKKLAEKFPANLIYKFNLSASASNLSICYSISGKQNTSLKYSGFAVKILEFIFNKEPGNLFYLSNLAEAYNNHGSNFLSLNQQDNAMSLYRKSLSLVEGIMDSGKASTADKRAYASSNHSLARILYKQGFLEESLQKGQISVDVFESIYQNHPEYTAAAELYSAALITLSEIHKDLGDMKAEAECNKKYYEIAESLYKQIPDDENIAVSHAGTFFVKAEEAEYENNYPKAIDAYRKGEEIFLQLVDRNPSNLNLINLLCIVYYKLGLLFNTSGMHDDAISAFEKNINISIYLCEHSDEVSFKQRHQDFLNDIRNRGYIK